MEVPLKVSRVFHLWHFPLLLLLLLREMDIYEREIIRLEAFDDEVPTSDVSETSESENEDAQNIINKHDTDTEQEEPDEDESQ